MGCCVHSPLINSLPSSCLPLKWQNFCTEGLTIIESKGQRPLSNLIPIKRENVMGNSNTIDQLSWRVEEHHDSPSCCGLCPVCYKKRFGKEFLVSRLVHHQKKSSSALSLCCPSFRFLSNWLALLDIQADKTMKNLGATMKHESTTIVKNLSTCCVGTYFETEWDLLNIPNWINQIDKLPTSRIITAPFVTLNTKSRRESLVNDK